MRRDVGPGCRPSIRPGILPSRCKTQLRQQRLPRQRRQLSCLAVSRSSASGVIGGQRPKHDKTTAVHRLEQGARRSTCCCIAFAHRAALLGQRFAFGNGLPYQANGDLKLWAAPASRLTIIYPTEAVVSDLVNHSSSSLQLPRRRPEPVGKAAHGDPGQHSGQLVSHSCLCSVLK